MKFPIVLLLFILISSCTEKAVPRIPLPTEDSETVFESWMHSPIHPANQEKVTFKVNAWDESLIAKVELFVYEYDLFRNEQGMPSKKRRPRGLWGHQKTWSFKFPKDEVNLAYLAKKAFGAGANIEYIFHITNVQGGVSAKFATFDAGDSPWPNDKILLYSTTPTIMSQTINLAFLKDVDFGNDWKGYFKDVEHLVYEGYFKNNMIKDHKDKWAFYYTTEEVNGHDIAYAALRKEIFPSFLTGKGLDGIDAYGLLHRQPFKDGAYLMGNLTFLSSNLFTSESYNIGTAVHETAHAVFNLSDEYMGCVCYQPTTGANMFSTIEGCESFNEKIGVGRGNCSVIKNYQGDNWYMAEQNVYFDTEADCASFAEVNGYGTEDCSPFIDVNNRTFYRSKAGLCIMQDDGDALIRDFKTACSSVINDYYRQLTDLGTASIAPGTDRDNIFGYEPVVVMEFSRKGQDVHTSVKKVRMGVPTKNWESKRALELSMCRKDHSIITKINMHDPKMLFVHHTSDGDKIKMLGGAKRYIQVPYAEDLTLLECKFSFIEKSENRNVTDPHGSTVIEVDLQDQVRKAYRKYEADVH